MDLIIDTNNSLYLFTLAVLIIILVLLIHLRTMHAHLKDMIKLNRELKDYRAGNIQEIERLEESERHLKKYITHNLDKWKDSTLRTFLHRYSHEPIITIGFEIGLTPDVCRHPDRLRNCLQEWRDRIYIELQLLFEKEAHKQ